MIAETANAEDIARETKPLIASLANAPAVIVPLVHAVPPEVSKRRPSPDKWSAHEHACHLATVHDIFHRRMDLMLSANNPHIAAYNPSPGEEAGAWLKTDLDEALDRYARERMLLVDRLRTIEPGQWHRPATHDEYNQYSPLIMTRHFALHDFLHGYRIEEILLKKHWPEA